MSSLKSPINSYSLDVELRVTDIAHQDEVVRTLKTSIDQGSLPHLMFHGPPGTGKTTTILAVAKELYGPELYRSRVLELNGQLMI